MDATKDAEVLSAACGDTEVLPAAYWASTLQYAPGLAGYAAAERQQIGLAALLDLATPLPVASMTPVALVPASGARTIVPAAGAGQAVRPARPLHFHSPRRGTRDQAAGAGHDHRGIVLRSVNNRDHRGDPSLLEARKETPGALNARYDLPTVTYQAQSGMAALLITALAAFAVFRIWDHLLGSWLLLPAWVAATNIRLLIPLFLSWQEKPRTATPRQQSQLASLKVVVAVPVYNEDPELLDRCIWSLVNSSRPPDVVHVVEDGPSADYATLREHWTGAPGRTAVRWTRMPWNRGKKHAQSEVFTTHPEADIFITVDSDTALEYRAIEEGIKPFADPGVASVGGFEEVINKRVNWLTLSVSARNTVFQLLVPGAQSVMRDLLVNRGTFSLYRAHVIREIIPAYLGETFLGRPIRLGDDSALTLFARDRGRCVMQITAVSLPVYPEKLSHHFRQRLRWARGSTIRHCWRIRYLSSRTYGWWFVAMYIYSIQLALTFPVVMALTWPASEQVVELVMITAIILAYTTCWRALAVRRSDDSRWFRAWTCLLNPVAALWLLGVVKYVRWYGIATFLRQRWTTRQDGIEVQAHDSDSVTAAVPGIRAQARA